MSIFSAPGPLPASQFPTLHDYVLYGGQARSASKHNWVTPNPINPSNTGTTKNFDETFINQPWFQQAFLLRKQKALNTSQALTYLQGVDIPLERGSKFRDIGGGTIGHTHTGLHGTNGSLLLHKRDNVMINRRAIPPGGPVIYSPK
jgi:hypothetical protein